MFIQRNYSFIRFGFLNIHCNECNDTLDKLILTLSVDGVSWIGQLEFVLEVVCFPLFCHARWTGITSVLNTLNLRPKIKRKRKAHFSSYPGKINTFVSHKCMFEQRHTHWEREREREREGEYNVVKDCKVGNHGGASDL